MPGGKDVPDWGGTYTEGAFRPLFDHGELAARLGSPVTWDRRGALVWNEVFDYGIGRVARSSGGGGSAISLSTTVPLHGPFTARMATGGGATDNNSISKILPLPETRGLGLAIFWTFASDAQSVLVRIRVEDGSTGYEATLTVTTAATPIATITTPSGEVTVVSGNTSGIVDDTMMYCKLVIDTQLNEYVRVVVAGTEYDVSGNSIVTLGAAIVKELSLTVRQEAEEASIQTIYADNFIVTAAEPIT